MQRVPVQHSPHQHSPHQHSPHQHSPHQHSPHQHSPHQHSPHQHSPHQHSPHQHSPHQHSPHQHSPHQHSPHQHSPHQHSPHQLRDGVNHLVEFQLDDKFHSLADSRNYFSMHYSFGQVDTSILRCIVSILKQEEEPMNLTQPTGIAQRPFRLDKCVINGGSYCHTDS